MRELEDLTKADHKELVLHAVLLGRTINKNMSKERDIELYDECPDTDLIEYIEHFYDPEPEIDWDGFCRDEAELDAYYTPCATNRDYGPSNPWDAPGMSVRDFI